LATLAFALMFETVLRPLDWVSGGFRPPRVPRPVIGSLDFSDDKAFFVLVVVLLALTSLVVLAVKRGTTGRMLEAVRGSEVAAASLGINPFGRKVLAFTLSGAIAGFGGGLLATYEGKVNYDASFTYYFGLVWVVLVVTLGARSIQAAINAGVAFMLFAPLLELTGIPQDWAQSVAFILFGLGALTYARHPEGIVEANTRASVLWLLRRFGADGGTEPPSAPPTTVPPVAAATGVRP